MKDCENQYTGDGKKNTFGVYRNILEFLNSLVMANPQRKHFSPLHFFSATAPVIHTLDRSAF